MSERFTPPRLHLLYDPHIRSYMQFFGYIDMSATMEAEREEELPTREEVLEDLEARGYERMDFEELLERANVEDVTVDEEMDTFATFLRGSNFAIDPLLQSQDLFLCRDLRTAKNVLYGCGRYEIQRTHLKNLDEIKLSDNELARLVMPHHDTDKIYLCGEIVRIS